MAAGNAKPLLGGCPQLLKMLAQSQQAVSLGKTVSSTDAFTQLRARRGLA
ncbi:hypothetical protein V3O24_00400 [Methylobacter sp. Wu8]